MPAIATAKAQKDIATVLASANSIFAPRSDARTPIPHRIPALKPYQVEAFCGDNRVSLIEGSTKSGKTMSNAWYAIDRLNKDVPEGKNSCWFAPSWKLLMMAFDLFVKEYLVPGTYEARKTGADPSIYFPLQRKTLRFGLADKSARGNEYWAVHIDEASLITDEEFWGLIGSVTSFARKNGAGKVRAIGNVRGKNNEFYQMCRNAQKRLVTDDTQFYSITAADAVAAGIFEQRILDELRAEAVVRGREDEFEELYYNVPAESRRNPFGGSEIIERCVKGTTLAAGRVVYGGIDFAYSDRKGADFTVVSGFNNNMELVVHERWQGVPFPEQQTLARRIFNNADAVNVDASNFGTPFVQNMEHEGLRQYNAQYFTPRSKHEMVESLEYLLKSKTISFPTDNPYRRYVEELCDYQQDETSYQYPRYSHPLNGHDDHVDALLLAAKAFTDTSIGFARWTGKVRF